MKAKVLVALLLLGTLALATNSLANSKWDLLPTPLMMMDEAGIPPDPEEVAGVLADPTRPPKLRFWAAMALAQLEAHDYLPVIVQAMDDHVLLVQQGAMLALQHIPAEEAVPRLCMKSNSHGNRDTRRLATHALFAVITDRATKCIVASATNVNEDYQTRWQALFHLWQSREPASSYDELVPTLNDESATLRALAAMALSKRYESDESALDSLGIRETLGAALLDHEMDVSTYIDAVERFELLTGTAIMLDPSKETAYFNLDMNGRAIVDERVRAWLNRAE